MKKRIGIGNSGNWNSGNWNSGNRNNGGGNSGNRNNGGGNSGNGNSGNWNSGDWNSGNWNSGNRNSGNCNSGNRNSGNCNSGDWNSGNWNSGYLNLDEPKVRIFGKETELSRDDINFPDFFYFDLNTWVSESEMTDKEKESYPSYVTNGGYLKTREYKQAFIEAWESAPLRDREKVKELPNFDADIFYQISGIRVDEDPKVKCVLGGKECWISRDSFESLREALKE